MADIKLKNTANTEFSISHNGTRGAKAVTSDQIVVAVETINDFPANAETGDTVIVKDINRGGTFIYDATQSAINNSGTIFDGWIRQYSGAVNVKWFGAVGNGITDDTISIQSAIDYVYSLYGGDTSGSAGYIGYYMTTLIFPEGYYTCGTIDTKSRFRWESVGKVVFASTTGTSDVPNGILASNNVTDMYIKGITFLYYDTVFMTPTGNADFSFITIDNCSIAYCNTLIDTISFSDSRSTTFKMVDCKATYGIKTLCKIYTDKAVFERNWLMHTSNSIYMYIDSYASFKDNVWVPLSAGTSKAYIEYSSTDQTRSLLFENERFGGEAGQCPIIVVKDVNSSDANDAYRQQGITFINCFMASNSTYNPNGTSGVRGCVILSPTSTPLRSINFIKFEGCSFLPNLSGGVVVTYDIADISTLLATDFCIEFDYVSSISATKGANAISSSDLQEYVKTPIIHKKTFGHSKGSGKCLITDTFTTGRKKATISINRNWPTTYHTPISYIVCLTGQGDTSYPNIAYGYSSIYILTISGENAASTNSKISFTKLHGSVGGASRGANADIVSAHWGSADTGSIEQPLTGTGTIYDFSITFGTRVQTGNAYIKPLYDFSLAT